MKKLLSLSVISTKLAFLACFSLMGVFSFTSAQAEVVPPCHQMMAVEDGTKAPVGESCPACDISQEGWAQVLVSPTVVDDIAGVAELVVLANWLVFFPEIIAEVENVTLPSPPEDVGALHAELIVKNSTVFRI